MSDTLPYLQSERHFRLYESYLDRIVRSWPSVIEFTPQPPHASAETLSTRIRIAKNSLRNNQWSTSIDMAKFIQMCDEVVVSTTIVAGKVVCGPRDLLMKRRVGVEPLESELVQPNVYKVSIDLTNPEFDLIKAIVVLHHYRLLLEPSKIKTDFDIAEFAHAYDVSVEKDDGNTYTIL